ncbi:MAG: hypothetical protein P4L33_17735 [Capsulimonadaceae bacterium]|nr:hypothetical protein [Capsulimonadaceae bacterium]
MLFGRKPAKVTVRLIDLTTGKAVGKTQVEAPDLPPTWETVPLITLGEEWQILDAQPLLAPEAIKAGLVDLIVRRNIAEGEGALYAEPSIAGSLAPILAGSSKAGVRRYQLLPEHWRQVEFVSTENQKVIDENLTAIRDILENHAVEDGFDKRHIRAGLDAPIAATARISLDEFTATFEDDVDLMDGVAYLGVPGLIEGGFAFTSASLTQYIGYERDGVIAALAIGGIGSHDYDSPEVQGLADFAFDHNLTLVEWTAAKQRNPDSDDFFQLFDSTVVMDDSAPV